MTDQELANALFNAGLLTRQQIEAAAAERSPQRNFAQIVLSKGWVSAAQIGQFDSGALPRSTAFEVTPLQETNSPFSSPIANQNPSYQPPIPTPNNYSPAYQGGYSTYTESVSGTTILVLGLLGILVCGVFAPFAWQMGNHAVAAIDAGRANPSERTNANVGRILGIIGSILLAIGVIFFMLIVVATLTGTRVSNTFVAPSTGLPPSGSFTVPR